MKNVKVYGADWCSDCITAKAFLNSKKIDFEYIDITDNETAVAFIEKVNDGKRIIPTLLIDGETYTNPGIPGLINLFK
jgi:thioredoxin reductase (NADPH)